MMRWIYCLQLLLIYFANSSFVVGQEAHLLCNSQLGMPIANHPAYPSLKPVVGAYEFGYVLARKDQLWYHLYPNLQLGILANYQQTGNARVLGGAWSVAPFFSWFYRHKYLWKTRLQVGWGLAYVSRHFDSFNNPTNIVIGSHLNTFATARCQLSYGRGKFRPQLGLLVAHYSNASYQSPNLGMNIVAIQAGVAYHWLKKTAVDILAPAANLYNKQRFSPFIQIGLGATARVYRGPVYPVYVWSTGIHWHYNKRALCGLGAEYSYNASVAAFAENNGAISKANSLKRYALWLNHEFLFGRVGFNTLGGLYLNKHLGQKSLFATELGLNFYFKNSYTYQHHQTWIGVHVRAYMGLADFVRLELGYKY